MVSFLLLAFILVPSVGYAHDVTGTKANGSRTSADLKWKYKKVGQRVGGYTKGMNTGKVKIKLRIWAYRDVGPVRISFSKYATAQPSCSATTDTQLGCTAPWTYGDHPWKVQIQEVDGDWTGYANGVRTQ